MFLELGYHDNPDDAAWVKNNLDAIARNIVLSLPLNQDVEKTGSNRCNLFIRQWEPVSICPNRWMAAKGS